MKKRHVPYVAATVLAGALAFTGCSQPAPEPAPNPETSDEQRPPGPIYFTPEDLQGKDVSISLDIPLTITIEDDADLDKWHGEVTDDTVAEFTAGKMQDGASFNPGFNALKTGTTDATLTGPDGKEITFTITVVSDNQDVTPQGD